METVGKYIKKRRLEREVSASDLSEKTKIKEEFIALIEKEQWSKLPDRAVVMGFVKNIAQALGEDEKKITAFFRRDYPPEEGEVNPKPDVKLKYAWTPKATFAVLVGVVVLVVGGYLGFQYIRFLNPPKLEVVSPVEGQIVSDRSVEVKGNVSGEASIEVNSQPFLVDEEGMFVGEIEVSGETEKIKIKAVSRSGKTTELERTIVVELEE